MTAERFCLIVPHYDHAEELGRCLPALVACGLPVLVVDDGSHVAERRALRETLSRYPRVTLIERPVNGGKGAAMVTGLREALARGFSHGIGMDADGQHEAADLARIVRAAEAEPASIVSGLPRFGADIPAARLYGRMITNVLARLEAGGANLRDVMCGFRCYPLARTMALIEGYRVRCRMDFDPEILVRAAWAGIPVRYVETRVRYPEGGVSHFRMFRDNVRMTAMHARLIAGALVRAPLWVVRRLLPPPEGPAGRPPREDGARR